MVLLFAGIVDSILFVFVIIALRREMKTTGSARNAGVQPMGRTSE